MELFNGTMAMIDCRFQCVLMLAKLLEGHFTKVILFTKRGAPLRGPFQLKIFRGISIGACSAQMGSTLEK